MTPHNLFDRPVQWLLVVALVWQAFTWVNKSVDFWVLRYEKTHVGTVDRAAVSILSFGARLALAVQNVLGNLLAAVAILFDKSFIVGDVIAVDNLEGTVERIGLLRSHLVGVGGTGFDFETVLLFDRPEASTAFNTRKSVLLGILERFEQSGIRLAQPSAMPAGAPPRADIPG